MNRGLRKSVEWRKTLYWGSLPFPQGSLSAPPSIQGRALLCFSLSALTISHTHSPTGSDERMGTRHNLSQWDMKCIFWGFPRKKHLFSSTEALKKRHSVSTGPEQGSMWPWVATKGCLQIFIVPFFLGNKNDSISSWEYLSLPYVTKCQPRRWKQKGCLVLSKSLLTREETSFSYVPSSVLERRYNS